MDPIVFGALITGIATLLATLVGVYVTPAVVANRYRTRHQIPDIIATWQARWYIDGELYVEDSVEITRWSGKCRFRGTGRSTKGSYAVLGQIDSSRIAVGTYEDNRYPTQGLIGTFVIELSVDARNFRGYWNGRTVNGALQTGTTEWTRIG